MFRILAFAAALALAAPAIAPAIAQERDPATMTVNGTGEVSVAPDMATLRVGVETRADSAAEARALTWLGLCAYRLGDHALARRLGEEALAFKLRLGLVDDLFRSYNALGLLAYAQGRYFDPDTVYHVPVGDAPARGPADAPVTIVEFSDFECPFCARFANNTAPALRRQYGDNIRWIFVNNPLQSIHPRAYDAGLAGECAADQGKFWDFYDAAFSGRYGLSNADLMAIGRDIGVDMEAYRSCFEGAEFAQEMAEDIKEGQKFYILGTPTFFINGRRLEGAQPPEAFAAVIDSILRSGS
ncbi:MAG: SIMPL domain-containing protein [Gemmatimonadetes bacterium]|nr:SIMPL domain-containing protein [Gemmatimonadota bacterium]